MIREWLLLTVVVVLFGSIAFDFIAEGIFTLGENTRAQMYFDYENDFHNN